MRPISWIHVSDFHMRVSDAWSQDVVLTAMCDDIARQRRERAADFILVSGDLAFSGKAEEYASLAMEMVRNTYFNGQAVRLDGAIRMAPR